MKRVVSVILGIVFLAAACCAAADEAQAFTAPPSLSYITGLSGNVAFALPGWARLLRDTDMPGYFRDSRQLAGGCSEDGAEFQFRSADIGELVDSIRADVITHVPDATEDVVRVNALFSYAMMIPFQMGAEVQSMSPHGVKGRDWLWTEGTFTYPDTPGVTYYCKAMLSGTQAVSLVIEDCSHARDALDALRFLDDGELEETRETMFRETAMDFNGISVTFPREPATVSAAQDGSGTIAAFAPDWGKCLVQFQPLALEVDIPAEEQLDTMITVGKKAIAGYGTESLTDPVLSQPAPDMLRLDFRFRDDHLFGEYGPEMRACVLAGDRGVWYIIADDTDDGRRFLESVKVADIPAAAESRQTHE